MKIKINKTEIKEAYPDELCDEIRDDIIVNDKKIEIKCLQCEKEGLATQKEVTMEQLKKTLIKILKADYIDQETKDFILQDEDLFPIIQQDWELYQRITKTKECGLVINKGKIFLEGYE